MSKAKKKTKHFRVKVNDLIDRGRKSLDDEKSISPPFKEFVSELLDVLGVMSGRLGINSSNSSKPPSQDPNRERKVRKAKGKKRKPGGQIGHPGNYLKQVKVPTSIEEIQVDLSTLPPGEYSSTGRFESRQVFDVEVSLHVTEYRAEIVVNEDQVEFTFLPLRYRQEVCKKNF
jgi:transposase